MGKKKLETAAEAEKARVSEEQIYETWARKLTTQALIMDFERTIEEKGWNKAQKKALQREVNRRLAVYYDLTRHLNHLIVVDRPKTLRATVDQARETFADFQPLI